MAACGTFFMVMGAIYGYLWTWGPIIWGLIGLAFGSTLGYILDRYFNRALSHKNKQGTRANSKAGRISEVVLIIELNQEDVKMVEGVLWENSAIGVS